MKVPEIPEGAEVIRTYAELDQRIHAFFEGFFRLLIVMGRPGLAKSSAFARYMGPASHLLKGWLAPLQAYIELFRHRNKHIIMDDAEVLWQRPAGRILMRSVCEHKPSRTVQWTSTTGALTKAGVPQQFTTSSSVAVITNRAFFGDAAEAEAIFDRAHVLYFDPYVEEVHREVAGWFWDQQILDFVGERLHLLRKPSARLYIKAWECQQAQGDWRKLIEECYCHDSVVRVVQELETDPTCSTVREKVKKFMQRTGASRASYYNIKRRLTENHQLRMLVGDEVPRYQVRGQPPVQRDVDAEVAKAQEEDRTITPASADDEEAGEDNGAIGTLGLGKPPPVDAGTRGGCSRKPKSPPDDDPASWLRRELAEALRREDYDRAAALRDALKRLSEDGESPSEA